MIIEQLVGRCVRALLLSFTIVADLYADSAERFFAVGDMPCDEVERMVLETFLNQELGKGAPFSEPVPTQHA